jgi:ABC-type glycerol-3-phosphate transport system substrate-binding protein
MAKADLTVPVLAAVVLAAWWGTERITRIEIPPGPVHITYWEKWTGFELKGITAIVNDFNKSQNRIHVDLLSISDIGNKTLMAVSADVPPDVAGLWGPNVAQYADDHAIQPLEGYCKEFGVKASDYIPVYWNICNYNGHVYALPSTPASTALHYNTSLFKEAGLDPNAPPETLDELVAMSEKLTKRDTDGSIAVAGFLPAEPGWWNWAWGCMFGGRLWDGKGKITANEPENVRGFEWVQSFAKRYGPEDIQVFQSGFGNYSSPENAFLKSKVAMELHGVYMHYTIRMYQPGLKWAAAPFPYPKDRPDMKGWAIADEDVLVIPRGARHPREAFEFIRYVQSQKAMEKLCLLHRKNSPLSHISDDFWRRHEHPYIRLFDRLARSSSVVEAPKIGIWPEYSEELGNAFEEIMLMQKSPQRALDDVTARMQPKLDQYLRRLRRRGELQ